jgi:hypothetical protein
MFQEERHRMCLSAGNGGGATSPQAEKCPRNAVKRVRPAIRPLASERLIINLFCFGKQPCWNSQLIIALAAQGQAVDDFGFSITRIDRIKNLVQTLIGAAVELIAHGHATLLQVAKAVFQARHSNP